MRDERGVRLMADRTRRFPVSLSTICSILAIMLLLAACGGSDSGNGNEDSNDDGGSEQVNEAQAIFVEVGCAECHGDQGQGVDGEGSSLQGTRMIYNAFQTRVRNGRGQQMPAYTTDEISDDEIQIIHDWLRTQ
jgi:mono/diheme cytochrome c family protein